MIALKSLLLVAAVSFASTTHAQITFPVTQPALKVGERWKMLSLDGISKLPEGWREDTVTAVDDSAVLVSVTTNAGAQAPDRFDRDWNTLADFKGKIERQVRLQFPLEDGKTWDSKYDWINARGHDGRMEISYKVRGTERVTVPAGAFDAVVIDGRGAWFNKTFSSTGVAVERLWYAPQAKRVIKRTWVTRYSNGIPDQNRLFELSEMDVKL